MLELLISLWFLVVFKNWMMIINSLILYFFYLLFQFVDSGDYNLKLVLIMLSVWLIIMMMMSVKFKFKSVDLAFIFIMLLFFLTLTFYSESLFMFYLGFEMSVFPVLLIIYGWGYQPDRLEAGVYMMLYTMFFSLPLLLGIFYFKMELKLNFITYLIYMMAFLSKLPMVGFHLWLPRAHVEAPVFGSMILAGVMLKLGGYGVVKISLLMGDQIYMHSKMIIVISILGGVYLSMVCLTQSDMKMLVAYSSIVHMSMVLSGLLTMQSTGIMGSIFMMIGHGMCSSGLFYILGVTYNCTLSRSIFLNKGILILSPTCSLWWFMFCSSNLSFPPCLNLPGELLLMISILSWGSYMYILVGALGFISSLYSIYLFSFTQQGHSMYMYSFNTFKLMESLVSMMHWVPLNLVILDLSLFWFY